MHNLGLPHTQAYFGAPPPFPSPYMDPLERYRMAGWLMFLTIIY